MQAILGYLHALAYQLKVDLAPRFAALRGQRGQGTVEYVGLILLVAVLMAGMVVAVKGFTNPPGQELADAITKKIVQAVRQITFK